MRGKINENPVILINSKKNLLFYLNKCEAEFRKSPMIELNAIGNASGMLIKVVEAMQRVHGSRVKSLLSSGFLDRKQYKKRKLKLIARLENKGSRGVLEKEMDSKNTENIE